jgi:hypothetical protein
LLIGSKHMRMVGKTEQGMLTGGMSGESYPPPHRLAQRTLRRWSNGIAITVTTPDARTAKMPDPRSHEDTMFGFPAESVQAWSNARFIAAVAAAAVLTFLIYQSSSLVVAEKDRAMDAYKSDAQVRIAAAQRDAESARAAAAQAREQATALAVRAAGLEQEAAAAKERAAGLEQETAASKVVAEQTATEKAQLQIDLEHEKTARAEFQSQFSWRILGDEQRGTLIRELSGSPHIVAIEFPGGDMEAQFLSLQLTKVFQEAGWKVALRSNPSAPLLFGLNVPGPTTEPVSLVRRVLADVEMKPSEMDAPTPGTMTQTGEAAKMTPDCRIMVGAKLTETVRDVLAVTQAK